MNGFIIGILMGTIIGGVIADHLIYKDIRSGRVETTGGDVFLINQIK